jgi:putative hemolysin
MGMDLPESEEYDTLGGLIFAQLAVIPEDGTRLELDVMGLHICVEELADRRVEWAQVSRKEDGQGPESKDAPSQVLGTHN